MVREWGISLQKVLLYGAALNLGNMKVIVSLFLSLQSRGEKDVGSICLGMWVASSCGLLGGGGESTQHSSPHAEFGALEDSVLTDIGSRVASWKFGGR